MNKITEDTLPLLPLRNSVLFPFVLMPLVVGRPSSVAAVEAALERDDRTLAVFAQNDASMETPGEEDIFSVGTLAVIKKHVRDNSGLHLVVQGGERIGIAELTQRQPCLAIRPHSLPAQRDGGSEAEAMHRAVIDLAGRMSELVQPSMRTGLAQIVSGIEAPIHQVFLLASLLGLDMEKQKALLSAATDIEAMHLLFAYLSHEVEVLEIQDKIASQAQSKMGRDQREYMLRQQLKAIQEELGEQRPEQMEAGELRMRLEEHKDIPDVARREVEKELARLERMPPAAPDYQITRGYVELVLELPWNEATEDVLDLKWARGILDEDHFDLNEVKDRIIEHLAVMRLNPNAKAPILCFVGPPGVGKTSLGKSIARALGRHFERMSLGGLHDEAELRGHRRTYVGAMPGRLIRALRRAGVNNPVLMLDEVDKLGRDFRGDPAAALLEVLDPAQNVEFHDNYLDLPFDLSKVFFITTANTLDQIPGPLRDRMEILRLSGYSDDEKRQIATRYLIGRQIREAGLQSGQLTISPDTLGYIIRRYTREAGVRELERVLGRLARKMAVQVAQGNSTAQAPTPNELNELLGSERFYEEAARAELAPGVAAGLAWTEAGGDVLYVEATLLDDGRELILTGQLGEVMQESAKTAQSYVRSHFDAFCIDDEALRKSGVHIHVPAGAIPKDGPSAGVTMVTALAALYVRQAARSDTAMTGETTLSGLILPVGGIKEKLLAAHRAGMRRVIIPKGNENDLRELPDEVRKELEVITATHIDEVLAAAIPEFAQRLEAA